MDKMLIKSSLCGILLLSLLVVGCSVRVLNPGGPISGNVAIWVSADQDTYISCGRTSACEEGNLNFGSHSPLAVAGWDLARKLPFVRFELPQLPAGTEILEAYVELYHNGQREDGRTDDVKIPASNPSDQWDAMTLTWNNRPNTSSAGGAYNICLRSLDWSGSPNIASDIQGRQIYDAVLNWSYPTATPPIEKGFASANDNSRTANDLGLAPRLVIRAQLPPGTAINSRAFRTFQPGEDLGRLGQPVLMSVAEATTLWPPAWQVAATSSQCQ